MGCQKEKLDISTPADVTVDGDKVQLKGKPITVEDAQTWFEQSYGKVLEIPRHGSTEGSVGQSFDANSPADTVDALFISQAISVTPKWTQSKISTYLGSYPILYVPVNPIPFFDQLGFKYKLVFYRENGNQINSVLQLYQGEEAYAAQNTQYQVSNFTGLFAQIRLDGCIQRIFNIENGLYKSRFFSGRSSGSSGFGLMLGPGSCYNFGTSFGQRLLAALQSLFSGECGGGNGDVTVVIITRPSGSVPLGAGANVGNFGQSYGNTDGGGGGGGGSYLCTYPGACLPTELTNDIFNGDGLNSVLIPLQSTPEMTDFLTNWDAYDPKLTQALYNGLHQTSIASTEIERINIVRQFVELLMTNQPFLSNESRNFNVSTIWYFGKYLRNGFTKEEFADFYLDQSFFAEADNFLVLNFFDNKSKKGVRGVRAIEKKNWTSGYYTIEQLSEIQTAFNQQDDPILGAILQYFFAVDYLSNIAILKKQHPDWSKWKIALKASDSSLHLALDMCGLAPLWGEPCDIANGIFYTVQGDALNASLSFGSAIPFVGWFAAGAKFGVKVIGQSGRTYQLGYKAVGTLVEFGEKTGLRAQLRRILQTPTGGQAHHLVPLDLWDQPLVQAAAKAKAPFHINEVNNGINMSSLYHNGSHPTYTEEVRLAMARIYSANGGVNIQPYVAQQELQRLLTTIKDAIVANPTTNINNIRF